MTEPGGAGAAGELSGRRWGATLGRALRRLALAPRLRQRALIVLAALLVLTYAIAVQCYSLLSPDIGVRCAFTPVVNHFYPEYLAPDGGDPPHTGDTLTEVAGHRIDTWPQFLRALFDLQEELHDRDPEKVPLD